MPLLQDYDFDNDGGGDANEKALDDMLADAVEVAHNVSLDNINNDDIIQERKFVSGGQLPQIQESAFVTQINEHEKHMTRAEHARI